MFGRKLKICSRKKKRAQPKSPIQPWLWGTEKPQGRVNAPPCGTLMGMSRISGPFWKIEEMADFYNDWLCVNDTQIDKCHPHEDEENGVNYE